METGDIWVHKSRIPKYKDYKYNNFFSADPKAIDSLLNIMLPIALKRVSKELKKFK